MCGWLNGSEDITAQDKHQIYTNRASCSSYPLPTPKSLYTLFDFFTVGKQTQKQRIMTLLDLEQRKENSLLILIKPHNIHFTFQKLSKTINIHFVSTMHLSNKRNKKLPIKCFLQVLRWPQLSEEELAIHQAHSLFCMSSYYGPSPCTCCTGAVV